MLTSDTMQRSSRTLRTRLSAHDRGRRSAFTLVELLVVIAVIGVLMALLLPAVQAARSAARRTQCKNNLRQIALATQLYHDSYEKLPSGIVMPNRTLWSASLLPHLEQGALARTIDYSLPWNASPNADVLATWVSVYRCPSSTAVEHIRFNNIPDRVPSNYLACSSGLAAYESSPGPLAARPDSDGLFFINSRIRSADILDGASQTVAFGEAIVLLSHQGIDGFGLNNYIDHWYIGTVEGAGNEVSESMGSTAAPVNAYKDKSLFVDMRELAFSSRHAGGAQVAFADGHVQFIAESIDLKTWSALGTRAGGEVAQAP